MDSSGFRQVADGIISLVFWLFVLCAIFVPLGIWKLVNLFEFAYHHVHISVQ